jgi:hypothetical protein
MPLPQSLVLTREEPSPKTSYGDQTPKLCPFAYRQFERRAEQRQVQNEPPIMERQTAMRCYLFFFGTMNKLSNSTSGVQTTAAGGAAIA